MIIKYALATEKSIRLMESENKLGFIVDRRATKHQIKEAIETELDVKVEDVKTINTPKGLKKAYVKFGGDTLAIDVATKLGLM